MNQRSASGPARERLSYGMLRSEERAVSEEFPVAGAWYGSAEIDEP